MILEKREKFSEDEINNYYKNTRFNSAYAYTMSNILSKHIDFLICKKVPYQKENSFNTYYGYRPVLAIELNGSTHFATKNGKKQNPNLKKQQTNDALKKDLYNAIDLELMNINIEDDKANKELAISSCDKILRYIESYNKSATNR